LSDGFWNTGEKRIQVRCIWQCPEQLVVSRVKPFPRFLLILPQCSAQLGQVMLDMRGNYPMLIYPMARMRHMFEALGRPFSIRYRLGCSG
jgi:hypothetical protein